jgi:hypothetical protein
MARRGIAVLALLVAALAGCADDDTVFPPGAGDTATVVFRDGVSPDASYNGTRDALLKNGPTNDFRNRCYGNVPFDTIGSVSLAGAPYERRLVLKMDLSAIADCAWVLSASLSLAFEAAPPESITVAMHRVLRPSYTGTWIEGQNGIQTGVSWLTVDGAESWFAEGGDFESEPLSRARIAGDTVVVFPVPSALARGWIDAPATNHGVLLRSASTTSGRFALAHLREAFVPSLRPSFTVTYLRGG